MNDTLKPYVEKLLDSGMKTAEDVLKFVETQAPILGEEIIVWGAVSESVHPLIGILLIGASIFLHVKCRDSKYYYEADWAPPAFLITLVLFVIGVFIFIFEIFDVLYPLIAPRLYMLEKISTLIK